MGIDAMNALSVTTKNTDLKYGTSYHENFLTYLQFFQDNNIVASCAQTDSKGNRRYRPGEQPDPDQYLHVVERRPDGVVVRGTKLHNTMSPYVDEIIAIPTRALLKNVNRLCHRLSDSRCTWGRLTHYGRYRDHGCL